VLARRRPRRQNKRNKIGPRNAKANLSGREALYRLADRSAGADFDFAMSPVIPFRRRSSVPIAIWAVAAAGLAFAGTTILLDWWPSNPVVRQSEVVILRPEPRQSGPIEVIDGDTVRLQGVEYRLVGFDTPERGDKARCDHERRRAEEARERLRKLVAGGGTSFKRVACACLGHEELQFRPAVRIHVDRWQGRWPDLDQRGVGPTLCLQRNELPPAQAMVLDR
jgi:hypothetical protein